MGNFRKAAPQSALRKVFHYLKEQWSYLTNYLKDGRLELSNNRAERSIKPFVIDRKNSLFANTPKGATSSAVIFSMIQTAMKTIWLHTGYLKTANNVNLVDQETILKLLFWNAPENCHVK